VEQTDRISAAILNQLPSSSVEGIGFNELLRKLGKRNLTNSPTTLSKRLRVLERDGLVRRELVRSNPPRIVKLYKDPATIAAFEITRVLKEQVERTMEQNKKLMTRLAAAPLRTLLPSIVSVANSFPNMRASIDTSTLTELCASLRRLQRQMLDMSARIASLTFAAIKLENAIREGKLSPGAVRTLLDDVETRLKQPQKST